MVYFLSFVILISSMPIIKCLIKIEENTTKLQKDTEELLIKAKKIEKIIDAFKNIGNSINDTRTSTT